MDSSDGKTDLVQNSASFNDVTQRIENEERRGHLPDQQSIDADLLLATAIQSIEKEMEDGTQVIMDDFDWNTMDINPNSSDLNDVDGMANWMDVDDPTTDDTPIRTDVAVYPPDNPKNFQVMMMDVPANIEMNMFGLKWKFDAVLKNCGQMSVLLNGLFPFDDHGNPIILTFNAMQQQQNLESSTSREETENVILADEAEESTELQDFSPFVMSTTDVPKNNEEDEDITIIEPENNQPSGSGNRTFPNIENKGSTSKEREACNAPIFKNEKVVHKPGPISAQTARIAIGSFSAQKVDPIPMPESPIVKRSSSSKNGSLFITSEYICNFCGTGYSQLCKWKIHVQVHTGLTIYKCSCEKCGIPYRNLGTVKKRHNYAYGYFSGF